MKLRLLTIISFSLLFALTVSAKRKTNTIRPGELWLDDRGQHINAHGGGVMEYKGTYYWFGEHKAENTSAAMVGVTVYSSTDLVNWRYRGVALPVSTEPGNDLEQGCVLERPKVVYCPQTGKFVMWFHLELKGKGYASARYGVAVADKPTGPYTFLRSGRVNPEILPLNVCADDTTQLRESLLGEMKWWTPTWRREVRRGMYALRDLYEGQMARDQTIFVDDDGKAYHIYASEENLTLQIAQLTDDFTAHNGTYIRVAPGGQNEAPTIMKRNGVYWMITSGCTGWAPNAARLFTAKSIWGPWKELPNPCQGPKKHITFGAQGTFILKAKGQYIFMADIWRPNHPIDARYVWLPIDFSSGQPVLQWQDEWTLQ